MWKRGGLKFKIIDYYRLKSKKQTSSLHQSEGQEIDEFNFDDRGHWKSEPEFIRNFEKADETLEKKEFYNILENCLKKLPSKLATVFRLKMLLEVETEMICQTLNITDANYWVILHRAKVQLRGCMSVNWLK